MAREGRFEVFCKDSVLKLQKGVGETTDIVVIVMVDD